MNKGTIKQHNGSSVASPAEETLDLKELLKVLTLVKNGKLNARMPVTQAGISGRICEVLNDIIDMNERVVTEISSAEKVIGKGGNLSRRIELPDCKFIKSRIRFDSARC